MKTATIVRAVQRWPAAIFVALLTLCATTVTGAEKGNTNKEEEKKDLTDLDLSTLMKMDVVVVTAQKREQNLQEVGTSITAFDSKTIAQLNFTDTTAIVRQVPGLQFNQFGPSITVFNLRGVSQNDYTDHQEAPVAVYSDEAYVASMGALAGAIYDLERVEVLRGPQGTLFGRNATGGLIHFISQRPTNKLQGYVTATGGRFGQINTEAAFNRPLSDRLDARLSFATARHDGLISNRTGPDTGDQKQYAARLQFLFKPSDQGDFLLKFYGLRNDHERSGAYSWVPAAPNADGLGVRIGPQENPWGTCNGCDLSGYRNPSTDVFNQSYDRPGGGLFDRTLYSTTGHLNWKLGSAGLTSVTDYQRLKKRYGEDSDVSPNPTSLFDTDQVYRQFSQELRLNGERRASRWIAGIYYLDILSDDTLRSAFFSDVTYNILSVKTRTWAAFAQGEWDFAERWTAILGARYTHDEKTADYLVTGPTPTDVLFQFNPSLNPDLARRTADLPTAKLEIDYRPARGKMVYASANLGSKSGGFMQTGMVAEDLVFEPEKLLSYEAGLKTLFLDDRVQLNAAVFYYDYRDYQASASGTAGPVIRNYQARARGGEAELAVIPIQGFELRLGLSGLDSRVEDVALPFGVAADRTMPQAPKWSANALARYEWFALGASWSIQADAKSNASMYFTASNAPVDREPSHTVTQVRLGYASGDGKFEAAVFCKNLTDKRYRVYASDASLFGFDYTVYAPPRWYGASVAYRWN